MYVLVAVIILAAATGLALPSLVKAREEARTKADIELEERALEILTAIETLGPEDAQLEFTTHCEHGDFPSYIQRWMSVAKAIKAVEIVTNTRAAAAGATKRHS